MLGVDEKTKSQNNMEYLILLKAINLLYNYYSHKKISNQNEIIEEIITPFTIPNSLEEVMKKIMKLNLRGYFPKNKYENYNMLLKDEFYKKMDNQTELKIECIFKYLDLCLVLLYKEGENRFFNYLIKKENVLIKYYNTFKLLSLEKYSNHKNYKEISAFIYYILSLQNKDKNDKIKNYNESLELKINQIIV